MKKLTFDDYYNQGWNARVKGKSIDDNPYPNGGWGSDRDAWANWNSGYWTRQHEEETGHICLLRKVETVKSIIGEAVEKSSKPVATAASRALDAKEDLDRAE